MTVLPGEMQLRSFMKLNLAAMLVAGVGGWSAAVVNAQDGPTPDKLLRKMDQDRDGQISKDEFLGPPHRFSKIDADGDGFLTTKELKAGFKKRAEQRGGGGVGSKLANHPQAAWYKKLPIILTHTHIVADVVKGKNGYRDWSGTAKRAIQQMDENGIRASIVMSPPSTKTESGYVDELFDIAKRYPGRFKVSGGGRSLNPMINHIKADRVDDGDRAKFKEIAEDIIARGGVGFGETTALHFSFQDWHPFEEAQPDHPLYLTLADIAAKNGVPIDIHMEAVEKKWTVSPQFHNRSPNNPNYVDENIRAFERLLGHNPKAKIIWVHLGMDSTGQRSPALTRRLLQTYPNLYISFKYSKVLNRGKHQLLRPGRGIAPDWKSVIMAFPNRFTIGSDTFYQPAQSDRTFRENMKAAISFVRFPLLPPAVARKIAFENAQHLFNLSLLKPEDYPLPAGANTGGQPSAQRGRPGAHGGPGQKRVRLMDKNGDGKVAQNEFKGPATKFKRIDSDGDGLLTAGEFAAFVKKVSSGGSRQAARVDQPNSDGALSEADIRKAIIGNTVNFVAPSNGRNLTIYFAEDGSVLQKVAGNDRVFRKNWFFNKKAMLCRTFGRQNKNHCTKVKGNAADGRLTLFNNKFSYSAKLMKGKKLPK